MPQKHSPDPMMYEVVWERDGDIVCRFYVEAASELEAISGADAFLAKHSKFDFDRTSAAVRVRMLTSH
jgi:hypothetical protein